MISKEEYDMMKMQVSLTPQDVSELLEYRDVMLKFLDVGISGIRACFANGKLIGKENEGYLAIQTIVNLKSDLNKLEKGYKDYVKEAEEKAKKKDNK